MHQKPLPGPLSAGVLAERVNSSSPPLSPQVCWRSAKVQLNSGILERRRQNLPAALSHFQLASAIEPGYCEPGYWIGITLVNMGESSERGGGREGGREGVLCFLTDDAPLMGVPDLQLQYDVLSHAWAKLYVAHIQAKPRRGWRSWSTLWVASTLPLMPRAH